jgi:hypothetical protein
MNECVFIFIYIYIYNGDGCISNGVRDKLQLHRFGIDLAFDDHKDQTE